MFVTAQWSGEFAETIERELELRTKLDSVPVGGGRRSYEVAHVPMAARNNGGIAARIKRRTIARVETRVRYKSS